MRAPAAVARGMKAPALAVSPLDAFEAVMACAEAGFFNVTAAMAALPGDLWRALPERPEALLAGAGPAVVPVAAAILSFVVTRRLLRHWRRNADVEPNVLVGLLKRAGLEFLALAAAAVAGRVLLVLAPGIVHGAPGFPSSLMTEVLRWLLVVTLANLLLQPRAPRFRIAGIDDAGARKAAWRIGIISAAGCLNAALLDAALRCGLPASSAKLTAGLAAFAIAAGTVQLIVGLRPHGMGRPPRLAAIGLVLTAGAAWLWGWTGGDFALYRAALGVAATLLAALASDRAVVLVTDQSAKPVVMRQLSVLRVVMAALASAVIVRIVAESWMTGPLGWMSPQAWRVFAPRLTLGCAMIVVAASLAAIVHGATKAWLTPATDANLEEREAYAARLSTALPVIRFSALALIGVMFLLPVLSALGINVTSLTVGAGLVGLAVSLGLQALVKDIAAGLFLAIDDAFRLGETIEFGGRHCQLERINLRSVRLRDRDGRLHTVPYGELGTVTNHSRRLVRITARITLDPVPDKSELVRFSREAAAALRREPMIGEAILGSIGVRLNGAPADGPSTLALSFTLPALSAERTRALVQRLFEQIIHVSGIEALSPPVRLDMSDLSTPPPSQAEMAGELAL